MMVTREDLDASDDELFASMVTGDRRGKDRNILDQYSTPEWCIDSILDRVKLDQVSTSCEPCRGKSVIFDRLPGVKVYCEIEEGLDYLSFELPFVDLIVTNPPFALALEFLNKSLLSARTTIYLLRINFLCSKKRKEFFSRNRPSHLYALSKRPSFTESGRSDMTEYAWFVWDKGDLTKDAPGIYVI